jgi:uncharacterized protein (TIGR03435 family)
MVKSRLLGAIGIVAVVGGISSGRAQTPAGPAFDVASIKPNKSGDNINGIRVQAGGRFTATNSTVRELITLGFGSPGQRLPDFQVSDGPAWIRTDRFDILANAHTDLAPGATGPSPDLLPLVRRLLEDRFKLATHHETRELPIYALVMVRSDRRTGPRLHAVEVDCAAELAALRAARGSAPAPAGPPTLPAGPPPCNILPLPGNWTGHAVTAAQLVSTLASRVDRAVVDQTGLSGRYDLTLSYTPDQMPGPPAPGVPSLPPIDPNGPSIFTALQEQLGLKLQSTTGPVDVLVIDHVERPTED